MSTRPKNDPASIALDARRVLELAREDSKNKQFAARVSKHELDALDAKIEALESGSGARTARLHAQVAAGVQAAEARAAIVDVLQDVRDDAKISFPSDHALQHAFGVGAHPASGSTSSVLHAAHQILAAVEAHPKEAARIGLDGKGVHHLEELVHALEGSDFAHAKAQNARHDNATSTDALAHYVAAAVAHVRLIARRVFRDDQAHLDRYASALPRHAVVPRAEKATPPSPPA
jgi:hypothetical protein